ncbi:MAG TPA: SH3 domain-containing protein, partial [Thermomicrobiales bacterium]|nr:SH3 domain-containing protein [Thermomicrobiales bacterium]
MYISFDSRIALARALVESRWLRLVAALALILASLLVSFGVPGETGAVALGRGNYAFGATMFGTAEGDGLVGDSTSSGYRMRPYDRIVALPACTQSSCPWLDPGASKNGRYGAQTMCAESDGLCWVQITSDVTGECAVAPVRDLGPLFVRDNWWGLQRERTYPLKRGLTAAEVTAEGGDVGFGPGMSDVGHDIAEDYSYAAAIDLGPGTWIDLGLDPDRGFSNVQVKLLWQAGVHHLDACGGDYGNAQTIDQVNLRQGPGTGYEILASLPPGRRLSITGSMQNGFYLVDTDGMRGWVSRDYVRPDGGGVG